MTRKQALNKALKNLSNWRVSDEYYMHLAQQNIEVRKGLRKWSVHEQLDLFSEVTSENKKVTFYGSLQDENWKTKTHTINGAKNIVISDNKELSKQETKDLCRQAVKIERRAYGFEIFYIENEINKQFFIRFSNETTKSKVDVFKFIDLYFDSYAELMKSI